MNAIDRVRFTPKQSVSLYFTPEAYDRIAIQCYGFPALPEALELGLVSFENGLVIISTPSAPTPLVSDPT